MESSLVCPVCQEIFKDPVVLTCKHNFCKECLEGFFRNKETEECPICRRRNSQQYPPVDFTLKTQCESLLKERNEVSSSGSEEICSLHNEKIKLFCLEDKQPVCEMCIKSKKHINHTLGPISEAVSSHKEQLSTAVKSLEVKREHKENIKEQFEKTTQQIKVEVGQTEHQIKDKFERLHKLIEDEEAATITALKEEEEQKKQMLKEKLEEMNRHISELSQAIKETEEILKADDDHLLKKFSVSMERVQISQPDPEMPSGASIDVSKYTENLLSRVWKNIEGKIEDIDQYTPMCLDPKTAHPDLVVSEAKAAAVLTPECSSRVQISQPDPEMPSGASTNVSKYTENLLSRVWKNMGGKIENIDQYTPVCLDPKTAHPDLIVSDDLTSVRRREDIGSSTDKPEEPYYPYVLGSEGFNSGTHFWDVEVKESGFWSVGVTTTSNQCKKSDVWSVWYDKFSMAKWPGISVKEKCECVRVKLDYESGTVSFSDPVTNTDLHTFTTTFTDTVFPFFHTLDSLRILPYTSQSRSRSVSVHHDAVRNFPVFNV